MAKVNFFEIDAQLSRLFFLPFAENETAEIRANIIDVYLRASGWTWDSYLDRMIDLESN